MKKLSTIFSIGCLFFLQAISFASIETACFIIGDKGLYCQPTNQPLNNIKKFTEEFRFDYMPYSFMRALYNQDKHIFVSYETWENFCSIRSAVKKYLKELGITHPKQQLYSPKSTIQLSDALFDQLDQYMAIDKKCIDNYIFTPGEKTYEIENIVMFGPNQEQLTGSLKEKKTQFKKQLKVLHQRLATLCMPLFVFNKQDWHMFDTGLGLYYFTPKVYTITKEWPVHIQRFINVETPFTFKPSHNNFSWVKNINHILDTSIYWSLYLSGHGDEFNPKYAPNIIGMPYQTVQELFKNLKNSFITTLYISSCFTFPQRLIALHNGKNSAQATGNDTPFPYDIFTVTSGNTPGFEGGPVIFITHLHPKWFDKKKACSLKMYDEDFSTYGVFKKTAALSHDVRIQEIKHSIQTTKNPMGLSDFSLLLAQSTESIQIPKLTTI